MRMPNSKTQTSLKLIVILTLLIIIAGLILFVIYDPSPFTKDLKDIMSEGKHIECEIDKDCNDTQKLCILGSCVYKTCDIEPSLENCTCGDHGYQSFSSCKCDDGWYGEYCDSSLCFT